MKASINAHPSNVMEAHQVLMKGGDLTAHRPSRWSSLCVPSEDSDADQLLTWL